MSTAINTYVGFLELLIGIGLVCGVIGAIFYAIGSFVNRDK